MGSDSSFSSRVVRSFLYSGIGNTVSKVVNVVALLIVLKLITADAFGVASIVLAIFAVVQAVTELGLGVAIVQADELEDVEIDSLFWISLLMTGALYAVIYLTAPFAAEFYRMPDLTELIRVFGLVVVFFTFYFVPRNLLTRDLSFGVLAIVDNAALLFSSGVMIVLAWQGFGAWSIILGELANRAGQLVLCNAFRPWRPHLRFDWAAVRDRVSFGLYATGSRLLYNLYTNADYLIVGRVFGSPAVGVYTFAYRVVSDTVKTFTSNINNVAYPAFARLQHERERLRKYFFTIARGSLLVIGLALVVIGVYIDELLVLGGYDQYLGAVPLIRIFAVVAVLRTVSPIVPQLLNAVGQARLNFFYSLSNVIIMPAAFLIGAQFGLMGVGWAWVIGYPVVVGVLFWFGSRVLGMGLPRFLARTFSGLWILLPLLALALVIQEVAARMADGGNLVTLIVGAAVTLSAGLAAIYLRERETIAILRGDTGTESSSSMDAS